MPGISFIFNPNENLKQKKSKILKSLKSMIHNERYKYEILIHEKFYFLGCTNYKEYPIFSFNKDEFFILLEGQIYENHSTINTKLKDLAKRIFNNKKDVKKQVAKWLLDTDGDFIIFILNKRRNEIYIINDALGRLPLYYYKSKGEIFVSRELRYFFNLINNIEFDRMAIAQYLLFGYPLGKRTIFENIYRLPPASIININLNNSKIKFDNVYQFNFEKKKYSGKNLDENVNNLVNLFCEACKNRTNSINKNVVSLSGGLDSRTVAAGLYKKKVKFFGATYLDFNKTADHDIKIAKQLAKVFRIDWKEFHLNPPKGKDLFELLEIKDGLNFLSMSYILPFFKSILETYGPKIINFSGDGGDKVLPDLRPRSNLIDLDELTKYIIGNHRIFSLDIVAALTKIDKQKIVTELKKQLMSYPEKDFNQKYIHFLIFERGFKWLFEGEDRNRFYFWSVTPFYSIKFFDYAMNCPDKIKSRYRLYRHFLMKLSPRASSIDYSNWGLPIASNKSKLYLSAREFYLRLPPEFTKILKKKYKKAINLSDNNSKGIKCFWELIENCKSISTYLSTTDIKKLRELTNKEFYNLFTIISEIEKLQNNKSTLEKYFEVEFP